jgi:hypothetical protein
MFPKCITAASTASGSSTYVLNTYTPSSAQYEATLRASKQLLHKDKAAVLLECLFGPDCSTYADDVFLGLVSSLSSTDGALAYMSWDEAIEALHRSPKLDDSAQSLKMINSLILLVRPFKIPSLNMYSCHSFIHYCSDP